MNSYLVILGIILMYALLLIQQFQVDEEDIFKQILDILIGTDEANQFSIQGYVGGPMRPPLLKGNSRMGGLLR